MLDPPRQQPSQRQGTPLARTMGATLSKSHAGPVAFSFWPVPPAFFLPAPRGYGSTTGAASGETPRSSKASTDTA